VFDGIVGLRSIQSGQAVPYLEVVADDIERGVAGRPAMRHIDRKAVGELGTVIGRDGMDVIQEGECHSLRRPQLPSLDPLAQPFAAQETSTFQGQFN
jgi:hypothetical protein